MYLLLLSKCFCFLRHRCRFFMSHTKGMKIYPTQCWLRCSSVCKDARLKGTHCSKMFWFSKLVFLMSDYVSVQSKTWASEEKEHLYWLTGAHWIKLILCFSNLVTLSVLNVCPSKPSVVSKSWLHHQLEFTTDMPTTLKISLFAECRSMISMYEVLFSSGHI